MHPDGSAAVDGRIVRLASVDYSFLIQLSARGFYLLMPYLVQPPDQFIALPGDRIELIVR